ncbi:uncharacterized protein DEA37_0011237 [Paragonimus westermani]|uniref:Protein ecdysoneless n=1 Tax=Paragonimus westermani TaxID=34504 RepID=A0A5J4NJY7_9TREM|nr:uncharacterized protein DEA37_0011237 [Paragonimus westermani]
MDGTNCAEGTVVYRLFFLGAVDETGAFEKRRSYLEFVAPWILDYPWYNERFRLDLSACVGFTKPILSGSVNFGESIEDEWFIVWLLMQITGLDPSVVIQVSDDDGEFLLIETAEGLPKWINPENAVNRVWIFRGQMGLLVFKKPAPLTLNDAINFLENCNFDFPSDFAHPDTVQKLLQRRIKRYPTAIQSLKHTAHVILPYPAAAVLSLQSSPGLIGAIVSALATLNHDPVESRKLRRALQRNQGLFRQGYQQIAQSNPDDTWPKLRQKSVEHVLIAFTFNRLHYAKMQSLSTPTGVKHLRASTSASERLSTELGLKICTGLDLLLFSWSPAESLADNKNLVNFETFNENAWNTFVSRLTSVGYFRGELPGSRLHTNLLDGAKLYFQDNFYQSCYTLPSDPVDCFNWVTRNPGIALHQLLDALESNPSLIPSAEELRANEPYLPPADDDSWMLITPEELDSLLFSHVTDEDSHLALTAANLKESFTDRLNTLVCAKSSYEGMDLSPLKLGGKRKPVVKYGQTVTTEGESDEDLGDWLVSDSDSEDGYLEVSGECTQKDTQSTKRATSGLTMADMMCSLMSKLENSSALTLSSTDASGTRTLTSSRKPVSSKRENLSSSSEEDLVNMYDSDSDIHRGCGRSKITIISSDGSSSDDAVRRSKRFPISSVTRPKADDNLPDYTSDEEPTAREVNWYKSSVSKNGNASSPRESTSDSEDGCTYEDYLAEMERELVNEPANAGRCVAATNRRALQSILTRNKGGVSNRKKARHINVRLAQPEDILSSDENREHCRSPTDRGTSKLDTLDTELADHVMRNLCASVAPGAPTGHAPCGPAVQLLNSIGIPVHQLAATLSAQTGTSPLNFPKFLN